MNKVKLNLFALLIVNLTLLGCAGDTNNAQSTAPETVFEDFFIPVPPAVSSLTNEPNMTEDTNSRIERLRVKHHQVECEGYFVSHCLVIQEENTDEWSYFYENIEGFDYQWGTNYEILVEVRITNTGIAKAPQLTYSLVEILSQTLQEPNDGFEYASRKTDERITQISPGVFSLLGNKQFVCDSGNCETLQSAIAQGQSTLLAFRHSPNAGGSMVLEAVLCADSPPSFTESCI